MTEQQLARLSEAVISLEEARAVEAVSELLAAETDPRVILESGLTAAMTEIGRRWQCGDAFLPEIIAAAGIFGRCSELIEPALLERSAGTTAHRAVIATVRGDLHDLGKNIVGVMMKTVGLEVHDLGSNVEAARIVAAVDELRPRIVGLSALLTTTMPAQKTVIDELAAGGLRSGVKVLVGGAPVTRGWADEIGADGYAPNAAEAASLARSLVDGRP